MCKMIISPGVFSIIENFDFYGCQGEGNGRVKKIKKSKILSVVPYISGIIYHDFHLWCICVEG